MLGPRLPRVAPLVAILVLLVAPAWPGATGDRALAHAHLVASSPGAGEVLDEAPGELRLIFSERLEPRFTSVEVRDGGGALVTEGGEVDPADRYALLLALDRLSDGVYKVTWRTLSADDGHTAEGFFTFAVGEAFAGLPGSHEAATHTQPEPVAVGGRWLTNGGFMLALGVPIFVAAVLRRPLRAGMRRVLAAGLVAAAVGTIAIGLAAGLAAGAGLAYFIETRTGQLLLVRAAIALAGAALVVVVPRASLAAALAGLAGLAGIGVIVAAGHAAALPGFVPVLGQAVHVGAAAVWASGVLALFLLWVRPGLLVEQRPPFAEVIPRFSAVALVAIGLVAVTGVHAAWIQTGTIMPADGEYWRLLVVKTIVAAGALALGAANFVDGGRMLAWLPPLRSRLGLESVTIGAVLLVTAMLAVTPPVDESTGTPIEPIPDAFGAVAPDLGMAIVPGRPGVNRALVTTTDALAGAARLELSLDGLEEGTTTRVPLRLEPMEGMAHGHGHGAAGVTHESPDGRATWSADALVLPPGSRWDTTVRILSPDGDLELSRQRFAFSIGDEGIVEGRQRSLVDPGTVAAGLLLVGGALGVGLGMGGLRLPRTEAIASRAAMIAGGGVAVVLGAAIGLQRALGG